MTEKQEELNNQAEPNNQEEPNNQPAQPVYGKPESAYISPDILGKKPELSGICPGKAWLLMLLAALPISFVYGVVAHYVGIAAGFIGGLVALIPNLLTSVCGLISWLFVIFAFGVMATVIFGYPVLMGYINGAYIVVGFGKKGLCRNVGAAGFSAAINGILAYLGHILITLLISNGIQPLTYSLSQLESAFDTNIVGIPGWLIVFCGVELILVVIGAVLGARDELKKSTFCEKHQCWYGAWKQADFPPEINVSLAAAIEAGDVNSLEKFERVAKDAYPRLSIATRSCPKSQDCDWELKATLNWQEQTTDKKGQTTINNKSEDWFDILLPADFGLQLEEKLELSFVEPKELKDPAGKKGKKNK